MFFDTGRAVDRPARKQGFQRPRAAPDRPGVDAVGRHVGAETDGQGVGEGMVPAGVGRDPVRLHENVAVEEEQNVVGRRPGAGVPGPGQSESAPLLADHPDV